MFSGYLCVKIAKVEDRWRKLRFVRGVSRVVSFTNEPSLSAMRSIRHMREILDFVVGQGAIRRDSYVQLSEVPHRCIKLILKVLRWIEGSFFLLI